MRYLTLPVLALLLVPLAGCGSVEFKEFNSPEGKFSVLMPPNPERKTQAAGKLNLVMYGVNVRNGAYAVGYTDVPPGTPMSLPGAADGVANSHAGKVTSLTDFTLDGVTGKEFEAETTKPKGYVSGRVIVVNNRFYQALAMGSSARLSDADVRKFLDSFKVTK
jgi:hypothetical protein